MITLIPLGISSAVPTRGRHLSATVLMREGEVFLFDCGEGTQFQMIRADVRRTRLEAILISHLHGDHFYGLMGLVSTFGMLKRERPLTIVGPEGVKAAVETVFAVSEAKFRFDLNFVVLPRGVEHAVVLDRPEYYIEARPLEHRVFTLGYRFQEKDRPGRVDAGEARRLGIEAHEHFRALKRGEAVTLEDGRVVPADAVVGPPRPGMSVAYCFDTRPTPNGVRLARDAHLVYHDATFADALHEKAVETGHSTAREAATVAAEAGAHRLLLGHFSSRYASLDPLVAEARSVFANTEAAEELKRYPQIEPAFQPPPS